MCVTLCSLVYVRVCLSMGVRACMCLYACLFECVSVCVCMCVCV